jgi:DNA repair exonuclease SbcCD ATPase subunit
MKKISIERLSFRNFKGIKELTLNLNSESKNIHGANGTGKTSVFDGFSWLLFGKNSENSADFNLKPLDKDSSPIHKLETEVEGVLIVDGQTITLKRIYKEKWTKKRGSENEELTGHETSFFYNEVPVSLSEYKNKVALIIDEELSKILVNTLYFNVSLPWKKRREILSQMVGEIENGYLTSQITNNKELIEMLNSEKNLEDEKKILAVKKKRLKDEIESIPSRIDEVHRNMPAIQDFEQLQAEIDIKETESTNIYNQIIDSSKGNQSEIDLIEKKQIELSELKKQLFEEKQVFETNQRAGIEKIQSELNQIKSSTQESEQTNKTIDLRVSNLQNDISVLNENIKGLRVTYSKINETTFVLDPNSICCPTCKRDFDNAIDKKEELEKNFNTNKMERLAEIIKQADEINESIEKNKKEIKELELAKLPITDNSQIISEYEIKLSEIKSEVFTNETLQNQIDTFVIPEIEKKTDLILEQRQIEIKSEIETLKTKLTDKFLIEKSENRIKELNDQLKTISSEIAQIERIEFQIEQFNNLKNKAIEKRVNEKFALVKFKMFNDQLNGGVEETCICTINGVPFADLNTASKINAGIDVINALQYHFNCQMPIFIDGRESVTEIIKTDAQVVSLVVDSLCNVLSL